MRSLLLALLVACAVACSEDHDDDHTHAERPAVCQEIGSRCHAFEDVSAFAKECHESAHETWTEAECNAKKADCFAACVATDAGAETSTDTGAADSGSTDSSSTDASPADGASDAPADGG